VWTAFPPSAKKSLEKGGTRVREGRGTEVGEAERQSQANVVRLPRDWLGPRENLVPFGPRAVSLDAEAAPPSAEDFWGERAATIHDALQAPANAHPNSKSAGLAGTPGAFQPHRVDSVRGRPRKAIFGIRIRMASADRRMIAAVVAGVAIAVFVVTAFASSMSSSRAHSQALGRSQGGFAAVLSSGVSNAMRVAQIDLSKLRGDMAVVHRAPVSSGRRTPHVVRTPKPGRKTASPSHSATVSSDSSAAAPSSPSRIEAPSSSTYPPTTQTYDASNESAGTHSAAPTRSHSSSTNPSNATLRSLITGAGTCSCK
jgi:hypothetical protein